MALVHASARRVPFSSKASFCLSLLTPLSRWPESNAARPLAGGSPLFWWHPLRSITLILVIPLQMKALYVRPMLSSMLLPIQWMLRIMCNSANGTTLAGARGRVRD